MKKPNQTDLPSTSPASDVLSDTSTSQPANMSRRNFGKMLGVGMPLLASSVSLSGCGGGGGDGGGSSSGTTTDSSQPLTRAQFVATISDYFNWVHSSEYIDAYKAVQPTFVDVVFGTTPLARQIETALEESVINNASGYFYPDKLVTREDVAVMYVNAFKIAASATNALGAFTDATSISAAAKASVNSMVAAGYMKGVTATTFVPQGNVTANDAKAIVASITAALVAPPQVMCKPGTTAPRRYIRISTPTDGATLYYTYTSDGSAPPDPTVSGTTYDFAQNGVLQFVNPLSSTTDSKLYRLKAVAKKSGMAVSAVREFTWNVVRPQSGAFQAKLAHAATSTSPAVWKINNPAEYYQAHVFYIEGSTRGIVFDAGEYAYQKANLKSFIDTIATKPYDMILGHNHPDHAEQVYNFTSAGIKLYASAIEIASLKASSRSDFQSAGGAAIALADGQVFDLGNVQVTAFQAPGHTDGLVTLIINQTGWVYGSDMWGCNRAYTADTTQYNGVKVDLFLSLAQQLITNYKKSSASGLIAEVTNAHQEVPVGMACVSNFLLCFQQLIDQGDAASAPSIRGGRLGNPTSPTTKNSRMTMVGDMWRNKNWMAIGNSLGTSLDVVDYFSKPTTAYPCGAAIDYNTSDGYKKYSVLSNIEVSGGTLVGVDVYWAAPANGTPNKLSNKFDPWTYNYTINVSTATPSIVITPTAMSNKIKSMKINGTSVDQGSSNSVTAPAGGKIIIEIVAADGSTSSTYTFSIAKV